MCASCGKNWDLGNFCPLCKKCYSDEDFDSKMMQCIDCEHWVHATCQVFRLTLYIAVSLQGLYFADARIWCGAAKCALGT